MGDYNFLDNSSSEEYYHNTFNYLYIDNTKFIQRKKINELDFHLKDEKEENIFDINNDFDYYIQNKIGDDSDKDKTNNMSKKSEQNNTKTIFMVQKIKKEKIKKKGRRNSKESSLFKSKHGKNSSDNVRKKIKRQFIKSIIKYINQLYIKYLPQKNKESKKLIYKIIPDFCNAPKKEDNNKYLSMTLRELFSSDLGNKFKNINKDYNKNNIEKLYKKNKPEEIIKLLNKTIKEAYEIYINDEIPDFSLYNDLKEIEKNNGIDDANIFKARAKKLMENPKKIEE